MKKLITIITALALLTCSQFAAAEEVTLNFSDADLVQVINSVSQITGKNFIIDPRVKGKVTVISSKPLDEEEVYNVFLSILQVHGFATVPAENATKIIPDATAKQSAAPFTSASRNPGDQLITRVLAIQHINAAQLVPILRPLVAQQGHLAAYPTTNVLIISDRAANIRRIDRIIAQMDEAGLDASEYQEQVLTVTGEITADVLDVGLVARLMGRWSAWFFDLIANDGPTFAFQVFLFLLIVFFFYKLAQLIEKLVSRALQSSKVQLSQLLKRMIKPSPGKLNAFSTVNPSSKLPTALSPRGFDGTWVLLTTLT